MRHVGIAVGLVVGAHASQGFIGKTGVCENPCLTYEAAHQVATNFGQLISSYTPELAQRSLASDFTDTSDSVNTLINYGCTAPKPLGSVTFTTRQAFMAAQSSQPAVPWELLNLWYACQGPVVMRWRSAQTPQPIVGNIVVEVERNYGGQEPWLMKTLYSEFNSGAWLVNQGTLKPSNCSVTPTPPQAAAAAPAAPPSGSGAPAYAPPTGAASSAGASPPAGGPSVASPAPALAPAGPPSNTAGAGAATGVQAGAPPTAGPPSTGPPTFGAAAGTGSVFGGPAKS